MEQERVFENDWQPMSFDGQLDRDASVNQHAGIDELLQASDELFDAIDNTYAQQYLEQNLQTGGQ